MAAKQENANNVFAGSKVGTVCLYSHAIKLRLIFFEELIAAKW
jgi:hypothetical protein